MRDVRKRVKIVKKVRLCENPELMLSKILRPTFVSNLMALTWKENEPRNDKIGRLIKWSFMSIFDYAEPLKSTWFYGMKSPCKCNAWNSEKKMDVRVLTPCDARPGDDNTPEP